MNIIVKKVGDIFNVVIKGEPYTNIDVAGSFELLDEINKIQNLPKYYKKSIRDVFFILHFSDRPSGTITIEVPQS